MRLVLSIGGTLIGIGGFFALLLAKSAIHEGVAAIIILIGATGFVGGALLEGINSIKSSIAELHEEIIAVRRVLEKRP